MKEENSWWDNMWATDSKTGTSVGGQFVDGIFNLGSDVVTTNMSNKSNERMNADNNSTTEYLANMQFKASELNAKTAADTAASNNQFLAALNSMVQPGATNQNNGKTSGSSSTTLIIVVLLVAAVGFIGFKQGWFSKK